MTAPLYDSSISSLQLLSRGKVRDIYAVDADKLLIITTDRLSAFDVILPDPIPRKGEVLQAVANFWFDKLGHIVPNQLTGIDPESVVAEGERDQVRGRAVVVKRLKPLPIEAVVRGYVIGSGWKDYCRDGTVSGIRLPRGLRESERLSEPIFTPSTKAPEGDHDQAITREEMENLIGSERSEKVIHASLAIYKRATEIAAKAGIIIADTKMEFGVRNDELILIDELLTPDSSRFWPKSEYEPGRAQKSFDKQFLRDYLLSVAWNQKPPAPELPVDIISKTKEKYEEALTRLLR